MWLGKRENKFQKLQRHLKSGRAKSKGQRMANAFAKKLTRSVKVDIIADSGGLDGGVESTPSWLR